MRLLLVGITTLSLFLVGCNESKKSRGTANARGIRSQNPSGAPGGTTATLQALECQSQDSWGLIYNQSVNYNEWMSNVKLFASASVNYEDIGEVSNLETSSTTGISFCGRVCTNSGASEVYIGIWDSFFVDPNSKFDSEISINIKDGGLYGGRISNRNPPTFEDQFGSLRFQGASMPNGTATGSFYFRNNPNALLGNVPQDQRARANQEILLGTFKIRSDKFWRPGC